MLAGRHRWNSAAGRTVSGYDSAVFDHHELPAVDDCGRDIRPSAFGFVMGLELTRWRLGAPNFAAVRAVVGDRVQFYLIKRGKYEFVTNYDRGRESRQAPELST